MAFGKTRSVNEFKKMIGEDVIDIIKNPNTGKYFFTCGDTYGAVSDNVMKPNADVNSFRITEVFNDETKKFELYVLHTTNRANVAMSI